MFDPKSPDRSDWDSKGTLILQDSPPPVPPRKKIDPKSPDRNDWDSKSTLTFPDLPPPVPPKKKITNQVTIPDVLYEKDVLKCSRAGQTNAQRVSIDLITFEDELEAGESTTISSKCSENSRKLYGINPELFQSINVAKLEKKQIQDTSSRESFMINLDMFFKDDLFKSPFNAVDSESKNVQQPSAFFTFSPKEGTLQHVSDDAAMNPFTSVRDGLIWNPFNPATSGDESGYFVPKSSQQYERAAFNSGNNTQSRVSEPRKWSSSNPFQKENFAFELQFPDDNKIETLNPKVFESCLLHCEEGVIKQSTDSKAEEANQFGPWEYDDVISYKGNSGPHVRDELVLNPFVPATSENEQTKETNACQYSIGGVFDYSRMREHPLRKHNEDESGYLVPKSSQQYERTAFNSGNNTHSREKHQRKELSDNEEDDYIRMGLARNTEFSCEYKSHQNKVDENQRRHQKANLKSDTVEITGISDTCRRSLLSQRSLSDNDIYTGVDVDDSKTRTCGKYEHSERKQVKTTSSKDNTECKAKRSLWSRLAKCMVKNSKQTSTEHLNWQTKLVCACGGSCERIDSLALSSDGHIWVSFLHCSWVSVYVHEYIPVRKFDAGCIVDCLAVSLAGVLYISCPMKKQILMLSKNLELIIMGQLNKLHPRGLAISPIDGAVVACMTLQMVGNVMKGPSKNCLMKFPGKKANEKGQVLNKEHFLGYPLRLAINVNGYILVSDFGLKCIFVVSQEGHMLNVFSTVGDRPFCQVHSLTSGHGESFYVVHGGRGQLSITRLGEYRGTVVETTTSRRLDPDMYCKVRATAVVQNGQLAVTSGTIIKYVSLD